MQPREADVAVVGAGIAGLVAATELVAAGCEVVVLEARDRVGGRVLNTQIGGEPNELGGQWVAPYQSEMHALLAELQLELFHSYREGDHVYLDADGVLHRYHGDEAPLGAASSRAYDAAVASSTRSSRSSTRRRRGPTHARRSSTRSASSSGSPPRWTTHWPATSCAPSWPAAT